MQDNEELEQNVGGDFFDELTENDFAFVVTANGDLKSVYVPGHNKEVPENIMKILEIFGINDVGGQKTLH